MAATFDTTKRLSEFYSQWFPSTGSSSSYYNTPEHSDGSSNDFDVFLDPNNLVHHAADADPNAPDLGNFDFFGNSPEQQNIEQSNPMICWSDDTLWAAQSNFFNDDLGADLSLPMSSGGYFPHVVDQTGSSSNVTGINTPSSAMAGSVPLVMEGSSNRPSPKTSTLTSSTKLESVSTDAKVSKTFHFVSNDDKQTATRLRNTMASRKHRQSKISRIAELEKLLEEEAEETALWRQRAKDLGWKD